MLKRVLLCLLRALETTTTEQSTVPTTTTGATTTTSPHEWCGDADMSDTQTAVDNSAVKITVTDSAGAEEDITNTINTGRKPKMICLPHI